MGLLYRGSSPRIWAEGVEGNRRYILETGWILDDDILFVDQVVEHFEDNFLRDVSSSSVSK